MLIDQKSITVGVSELEVRRTLSLYVRFLLEGDPSGLQDSLKFAHILEVRQDLLVLGPPWVPLSVKALIVVWMALLVLLGLTAASSYLALGTGNTLIICSLQP